MNKEEFEEWTTNVHCSLFHVEKTDLDDRYGVRYDQLIVIQAITHNPTVLKHRTLEELLKIFDVLV